MMDAYTVVVTREDNLWVADVQGTPRGVVGAMDYQNLADLHEDVPLFIADLCHLDEAEVSVEYRYQVNGHDVTSAMRHLFDAERELRRVTQDRERARHEALGALSEAGVSQRVMADALGVSHQRVHQLVKA